MKFLSAVLVAVGALMVAGQAQPSWPGASTISVNSRDLNLFQNRLLSVERNINMDRLRQALAHPEDYMTASRPSPIAAVLSSARRSRSRSPTSSPRMVRTRVSPIGSTIADASARISRSPQEGLNLENLNLENLNLENFNVENLPQAYSSSPLAGENGDGDSSEAPEAGHGKKIQAPRGTIRQQTAAPLVMSARTLETQQLPDQKAKFTVPLTKNHVENVEQPIIQRVVQPYHQRIVRQPKPVVQPYNTRVIQPLIQQEITPVLSTVVEQAKPLEAEFLKPIQNADVVLAPRTSSTTKPLQRTAPRVSGKKH